MRNHNGKINTISSINSCYDDFLKSVKVLEETNILQTCFDEKSKMLSIDFCDENGEIITIEIDLSDIDTYLSMTISKIRLLTVNLKSGSIQFVLINNNHILCSKITHKCVIGGFYYDFLNDVKFLVLSTNGNLIAVRITNDSFKFANSEIQIDRIRFLHYSKKNNTLNLNNTKYYTSKNNNDNNDDGGLGNNLNYDNKKDDEYTI